MADTVQCDTHGEPEKTYVCAHLAGDSTGLGFNSDNPTDDNPFPSAWCDDCEIIREAHGEWNDESQKLTKIVLLCARCYERTRIRNTRPTVTLDDLAELRWQCGSCDEWHTGPMLDIGYDAPRYWREELEKSTRWSFLPSGNLHKEAHSFLDTDYCAVDDEDFFVRGVILLPIIGTSENFGWGVWGSVSRDNFEALLKTDQGGTHPEFPPMFSWLSNQIAGYPDTLSLKMYADIQKDNSRPNFRLQPSNHPLAQEFLCGITPERIKEIMISRLPATEQ